LTAGFAAEQSLLMPTSRVAICTAVVQLRLLHATKWFDSNLFIASQPFANLMRSHLCAADGGSRLLGDYETEQLCAKLTLGELQGLCASLAADGVDREQMIALLEVRHGSCLRCPLG